jgi:hypothetical protein
MHYVTGSAVKKKMGLKIGSTKGAASDRRYSIRA